ncbi:MAG: hypothetical protein N2111_10700 [Candidatus Sumerlaeaceae bacterium]|nr:hypothetical protein [Candidatus Sumerlaeaceae bacterium]
MKIFCAVQATGRGHLSRYETVRRLLLDAGHGVHGFASGRELPAYAQDIDEFVTGPTFFIHRNRVSLTPTALHNARHFAAYQRTIRTLAGRFASDEFDRIIIDFEPLAARAARRAHRPFTILDNQTAAFLDTPCPAGLASRRALLRGFVRFYYNGFSHAERILTCSLAPLDPVLSGQIVIPPCVRPEISALTPRNGNHLLFYKSLGRLPHGLAEFARAHSGAEVRVYAPQAGHAADLPPNVIIRGHDHRQFLDDFASCRACVTYAGFESVAEAVHLGKPVVVVPIAGQWEQQLNAAIIRAAGIGSVAHDFSRETFELAWSDAPAPAPDARQWVAGGPEALRRHLLQDWPAPSVRKARSTPPAPPRG